MTENRLYCEDCLPVLLKLKDEDVKVDLIYLDPPFNSNRSYNVIFRGKKGDEVQQLAFADTFANRNVAQLKSDTDALLADERISSVTRTFLRAWLEPLNHHSRPADRRLLSYLLYMAQRLVAMKDVLSDKGSIFYHCDQTASHYIKIIMDGIFGSENFRNEIVWAYRKMPNKSRSFQRNHDVIFLYAKNKKKAYFETLYGEPTDGTKRTHASARRRGYNVNHSKRMVTVFDRKKYETAIQKGILPSGYSEKEFSDGKPPMSDWWSDIKIIGGPKNKERKGYQTQKPILLLKRVIQSSCPPNGVVLDPFCGCGTTIDAADDLGRRWLGIDISYYATDIIRSTLLERRGVKEDEDYKLIYGNPETIEKYRRMTALEKQDFAIRAVGGIPNDKHTGDGGIDGEMRIHLGFDDRGDDKWGRMVFSVKTGKQRSPALVRELIGTMKTNDYDMAGLIIDADPTEKMIDAARKIGELKYELNRNTPPYIYDKVQILTTDQIINHDVKFDTPRTLREVMAYRDSVRPKDIPQRIEIKE